MNQFWHQSSPYKTKLHRRQSISLCRHSSNKKTTNDLHSRLRKLKIKNTLDTKQQIDPFKMFYILKDKNFAYTKLLDIKCKQENKRIQLYNKYKQNSKERNQNTLSRKGQCSNNFFGKNCERVKESSHIARSKMRVKINNNKERKKIQFKSFIETQYPSQTISVDYQSQNRHKKSRVRSQETIQNQRDHQSFMIEGNIPSWSQFQSYQRRRIKYDK